MKYFTIIVFSVLLILPISNVDNVRNHFPEINSKEQAEAFIEDLKNDNSPEGKGYTAAMIFMKSRFVKFPFTKLKYFKKGKTMLDKTIVENPTNIELRYIRFLMQKQIPDFLGYNDNLSEDFKVIVNGLEKCKLQHQMKLEILQNILLTKNLISEDKDKINQLLETL